MFTLLMDHETFDKARRALLVGSFSGLIVSRFEIKETGFQVGGIEITIKPEDIHGLGALMFLYLLYAYLWRAYESFMVAFDAKLDRIAEQVKKDDFLDPSAPHTKLHEESKEKIERAGLMKLAFFDLAPPMILFVMAFVGLGGIKAAWRFLFS
jgi:hypothetical protein